jgi:2-amino-4-hydroxy-6-hydroxymethyldihydropteridine diphosphokinase
MTRVVLDLGSNIDREASLVSALERLADHFKLVRASSVYKTVPVGMSNQPDFFNVALEVETDKSIDDLRAILAQMEDAMGRNRSGPRFGPRNIDVDIVLYGDSVDTEKRVPHPQSLHELFVVVPLSEIRPDGSHPETGESWKEIRGRLLDGRSGQDAGVVKQCELSALPLGEKTKAALGAVH